MENGLEKQNPYQLPVLSGCECPPIRYTTFMRMNRSVVTVSKNQQSCSCPPQQALESMWELAQQSFSLTGEHDVERRLQRDVATLAKQGM